MSNWEQAAVGSSRPFVDERGFGLASFIAPMARPLVAGLVALSAYLTRAFLSPAGPQASEFAFFNYLADAFLHGQLSLRMLPPSQQDLVLYAGHMYLYWPPFPALLFMPLVAIFGVGLSDSIVTAILAALTIVILARLLEWLDRSGIAPLTAERRAILVTSIAFGSVVLILAPVGTVWFTGQIVGWGCVLLATLAALAVPGRRGAFLTGLALACAMATRISLLFNGLWLAYYLLQRDWRQPWRQRIAIVVAGIAPIALATGLLAAYNVARFGSPFEMGLAWHNVSPFFQADFDRYGVFSLHYLPTNLFYQFVTHPLLDPDQWQMGGSVFWMTPVLLGAPYAAWRERRRPLIIALVLSCVLIYIPIGLLMGTGWVTYGPRYLLDLMVPLLVLTAIGVRRWDLALLEALLVVSCLTYIAGSYLWLIANHQ